MESSGLLCGGYYTSDTCLQWSPDNGTWEELLTLDEERTYNYHVSWTPGPSIGTYLIGGSAASFTSQSTSTLVKTDGTQDPGFPLKDVMM